MYSKNLAIKWLYVIWIPGVASPPGRPVISLSARQSGVVEEDSVTDEINLSWQSPADDGGYPITGKKYYVSVVLEYINVSLFHEIRAKCIWNDIIEEIRLKKSISVQCLHKSIYTSFPQKSKCKVHNYINQFLFKVIVWKCSTFKQEGGLKLHLLKATNQNAR